MNLNAHSWLNTVKGKEKEFTTLNYQEKIIRGVEWNQNLQLYNVDNWVNSSQKAYLTQWTEKDYSLELFRNKWFEGWIEFLLENGKFEAYF